MAFHFSDLFSLVRSHPFVSCFLLLFLTPPLFPIVIYFSPLIFSTALCVLAVVSFSAHFSAAAGEGVGAADGVDASPTGEKNLRKVRVSKHEAPWMEWIKGCDETMRHFMEKQSAEDHELRLLSVKEEWSTSWKTNKEDNGELANDTMSEEEGRTVDKRRSSTYSVKQELTHVEPKKEDAGEEDQNTEGSNLRFSFFRKEENATVLPYSQNSDPNSTGHNSSANVEEKNASLDPKILAAGESANPFNIHKATEEPKPFAANFEGSTDSFREFGTIGKEASEQYLHCRWAVMDSPENP